MFRAGRAYNLCAVAEHVAVLVGPLVPFVGQADGGYAKLRQRENLVWLAYAVVVCVNPQPQRREDRIAWVNDAVSVAAVFGIIVDSERRESIER